MRCAVVIGRGKYADEIRGFCSNPGPRQEFIRIAQLSDADVHSYSSACAKGKLFPSLFSGQPVLGSVAHFASIAGNYDRCYVTGEDIGLPLALALTLRGWKGQIVCVVHNMTRKKIRFLKIIGHGLFSQFVVVSEKQRDILVHQCAVPGNKVRAVFNWVDDKFFHSSKSPVRNTRPVFMSCGLENRDYDTLVRAARKVDADFKIYGHGFFGSSNERPNECPNVEWMPRVSFDELRNAYAACDAVILPINNVNYAAGVTGMVEAMSMGKPVIVSGSRGLGEYLQIYAPRIDVPPGDADALAEAAIRIIRNPESLSAYGRSNREWILQNCALDNYAQSIAATMQA